MSTDARKRHRRVRALFGSHVGFLLGRYMCARPCAPPRFNNRRYSVPLADLVGARARIRPWRARASARPISSCTGRILSESGSPRWSEPIKLQWPPRGPRRAPACGRRACDAGGAGRRRLRARTATSGALSSSKGSMPISAGAASGGSPCGKGRSRGCPARRASLRRRVRPPGRLPPSAVEGIADPGLRDALARLGAGVLSTRTG